MLESKPLHVAPNGESILLVVIAAWLNQWTGNRFAHVPKHWSADHQNAMEFVGKSYCPPFYRNVVQLLLPHSKIHATSTDPSGIPVGLNAFWLCWELLSICDKTDVSLSNQMWCTGCVRKTTNKCYKISFKFCWEHSTILPKNRCAGFNWIRSSFRFFKFTNPLFTLQHFVKPIKCLFFTAWKFVWTQLSLINR